MLFDVPTPEDELLLQVPLTGGEPQEVLSVGLYTTICTIAHLDSKPLIGAQHGIWKIGW